MKVINQYRCEKCGEEWYEWSPLGEAPETSRHDEELMDGAPSADCPGIVRRLPSRGNFATFAGSHRAEYSRG